MTEEKLAQVWPQFVSLADRERWVPVPNSVVKAIDEQLTRLTSERDLAEGRLTEIVIALMDAVPDALVAERPVGFVRRLVNERDTLRDALAKVMERSCSNCQQRITWEQPTSAPNVTCRIRGCGHLRIGTAPDFCCNQWEEKK